jgi:hypothetical protein|tara:strand:- start:863 stop:1255 length:393 start_codon:yes stop_codon:yes gene_type:complete
MKEYQILKLQSGEEIVCNLVADEHPRTFSIESPLKIVVVPRTTRYGIEEAISLQRWVHFSEENTFTIDKNKVMIMTKASLGLSRFYDYCVDKMESNFNDIEHDAPSDADLDAIELEEEFSRYDISKKVYH